MGRVLNIKPIFHIQEGEIVSPGRVMLWQSIDDAIKKLISKVAGKQKEELVFVAHSGNPERCQELIDYFKSLPNAPKEILIQRQTVPLHKHTVTSILVVILSVSCRVMSREPEDLLTISLLRRTPIASTVSELFQLTVIQCASSQGTMI